MSTLSHVLRDASPERNWARAVTDLAEMNSLDQTHAWLELYAKTIKNGESLSASLVKVSQCDFLFRQALLEIKERRSFEHSFPMNPRAQATPDEDDSSEVSNAPSDTAAISEDDEDPHRFEPTVDLARYLPSEIVNEITNSGIRSSLNAVPTNENSEENTRGFNILLERVKRYPSLQNGNSDPIDTTRRLIIEFGTTFLYAIPDPEFPAAIVQRRIENNAKLRQPAPVGDVTLQRQKVKDMIRTYFEGMEIEAADSGIDETLDELCASNSLDVLAQCNQEQFHKILDTFLNEQATPSQPINAIPTADDHKLRPFPDKVRPEPPAPTETPGSSVGPSPFQSRASSVVPSPMNSRAASVIADDTAIGDSEEQNV